MYLKDLIAFLEKRDAAIVVPVGFTHPHSYRGFYQDLAFEPAVNVTVGEMLRDAKAALGQPYTAYNGGEYTMGGYTDVWLAKWGHAGEGIGPVLLGYMLGEIPKPAHPTPAREG